MAFMGHRQILEEQNELLAVPAMVLLAVLDCSAATWNKLGWSQSLPKRSRLAGFY